MAEKSITRQKLASLVEEGKLRIVEWMYNDRKTRANLVVLTGENRGKAVTRTVTDPEPENSSQQAIESQRQGAPGHPDMQDRLKELAERFPSDAVRPR